MTKVIERPDTRFTHMSGTMAGMAVQSLGLVPVTRCVFMHLLGFTWKVFLWNLEDLVSQMFPHWEPNTRIYVLVFILGMFIISVGFYKSSNLTRTTFGMISVLYMPCPFHPQKHRKERPLRG